MSTLASSSFQALDWAVLVGYFLVLAATGVWFSRRENKDADDYFLGGRRMPVWAVAVSIVATSMSAASFIGVPQQAYDGDLTYLSTNIGMILAAVIIAVWFIPAFYRTGVSTVYGYLETRLGSRAKLASSAMFMLGRIFSSGARVYIGAIPASIVIFGLDAGLEPANLVIAIWILAVVGIVYTLVGGISSVIWTDVIQMAILLGAALGAIVLILWRIPVPLGEVLSALSTPADNAPSKLTLFDTGIREKGFDFSAAFSLPAVIIAFTLLGIGSYGTDQDLVQRMLTCKDAKSGARSVIAGILFGVPSVFLFLVVGLLLFIFYQRPDLMQGQGAPAPDDSRRVFLSFIIDEMPAGLSGLMMAGLFAAGLSSLNSAINAMSSAFLNDFYRPARPTSTGKAQVRVGRLGVVAFGLLLGVFASFCVWWQQKDGQFNEGSTLLTFALTVMTFAYAGLIGVFLTALFTRRGNGASAIASLVVGFLAVLVMQPVFLAAFVDLEAAREAGTHRFVLWLASMGFAWKLTIASILSFIVCAAFPGKPAPSKPATSTAP